MTPLVMRLFVSVFAYSAKKAGLDLDAEMRRGIESDVPGFRTLARLHRIAAADLMRFIELDRDDVFVSATPLVAKARSRVCGLFLKSLADVWVTVDEDVDADEQALATLLRLTRDQVPLVVLAAMWLRDGSRMNVAVKSQEFPGPDAGVGTDGGAFPVLRGGLALAALPRVAVTRMVDRHPSLTFTDEVAGERCPALFLETLDGNVWNGEDVVFCDRARASGVSIWSFIHPGVTHAGMPNPQPKSTEETST